MIAFFFVAIEKNRKSFYFFLAVALMFVGIEISRVRIPKGKCDLWFFVRKSLYFYDGGVIGCHGTIAPDVDPIREG